MSIREGSGYLGDADACAARATEALGADGPASRSTQREKGEPVTTKEKAIRVIEALPDDASLGDIVEELRQLEPEGVGELSEEHDRPLPEGGVWELLEHVAGTIEMPADWASEHDHYLYGTPKRSSAA
jgi:hypothetical protein